MTGSRAIAVAGLFLASSCIGRGAKPGAEQETSKPPTGEIARAIVDEPVAPPVFEPFAEVVCRVEAEEAVILQDKFVRVEAASKGTPYACGSANTEGWTRQWAAQAGGGKVLHFSPLAAATAETPPLVRMTFRVPEDGSYYLFFKGDAWCCPSFEFRFRIDAGPARSVKDSGWGIGWWSWRPTEFREVSIPWRPNDNPLSVPLAHELCAGRHTLEILWAEAPCAGLILDQFAVAREPRLENASELLREAAAEGDVAKVGLFLSLGADVNAADRNGRSPLMRAEAKGHRALVEFLKECGATK